MASSLIAVRVLVDSVLVGEEILVDGECGLNWASSHDFQLDVHRAAERGDVGSLVEFGCAVIRGAVVTACSAVSTHAAVGIAFVSWDTVFHQVYPGLWEPAAVTAHVSGVTADEVLWAEYDVLLL